MNPATGKRRLPLGVEILPDGTTHFRVWAPRCKQVIAVVPAQESRSDDGIRLPLQPEEHGYFSGASDRIPAGTLYGYRLDDNPQLFPDPVSRSQPDGPEGLSQIIDPTRFQWHDSSWPGVPASGRVLYEMHIGTFTEEGTWEAASRELPELARIGITVVEVMPVAEFAGEFGWGYDGVSMFAPTRLYGTPDDFRRFVDEAHRVGIGVILDVVYNHFGPVGNYLSCFSEDFHSKTYSTDWGDAINFDGQNSHFIREFYVSNVAYWIDEFHLDGVRFDATQNVYDKSQRHILTDMVAAIRKAAGERQTYVIAENEPQDVLTIRSSELGGHGMDAAWNDDFHHAAMVRLTGHNEAYYSDFLGAPEEFLAAIKHGFIYQGQLSQWQKKPRGSPTRGFPSTAFVNFLQNHDQIANSGLGERVDRQCSPCRLRAMTALWLLAPQTPMFFQGQEFAASSPFLYFADWQGEQAANVTQGRIEFLRQFPSLATPEATSNMPPPTDRATFERCKLNFEERETHHQMYSLHIDLLKLRREDPVFRRESAIHVEGAALNSESLVLRFFGDGNEDRLLLVNFERDLKFTPVAQPLLAPPSGAQWNLLWSSNRPEYGGVGTPPVEVEEGWHIPGESAIVLASAPKKKPVLETATG